MLDWFFDRINLDPQIQIKYADAKKQLADILTKEISHVMSGIVCCVRSMLAISVLQFVLTRWKKDYSKIQEKSESQRNRRQWWVLLQGLARICHPRRHYHEQFTESSFSTRCSYCDDNEAWSSQEWKAEKSMDDGTGQPVVTSWWKTHESQSGFLHEKTQYDGTGQFAENEEKPYDRMEQLVVMLRREKGHSNFSFETMKQN